MKTGIRQSDYDSNRDGRLSGSEWIDWYSYSGLAEDEAKKAAEEEGEGKITLSLSFSIEFDAKKTLQETEKAFNKLFPEKVREMSDEIKRLIFYEISLAAQKRGKPFTAKQAKALRVFSGAAQGYKSAPQGFNSAAQGFKSAARKFFASAIRPTLRPFTEDEAALTEKTCGTFWTSLIDSLPSGEPPEEIGDICRNLNAIYEYFLSEDAMEPDGGKKLFDAFESHWYDRKFRRPDAAAAATHH